MIWKECKGEKSAKGLNGCDRPDLDRGEMREFQWCKQIENQTIIKKVASKNISLLVAHLESP